MTTVIRNESFIFIRMKTKVFFFRVSIYTSLSRLLKCNILLFQEIFQFNSKIFKIYKILPIKCHSYVTNRFQQELLSYSCMERTVSIRRLTIHISTI